HDATILLPKPPIGIQPPHVPAVAANGLFCFKWGSGLIDLRNPQGKTSTGFSARPVIPIDHLMIGVVVHRNKLGALEPQMNQECAVVLRKKSGLLDLFEIPAVMIVVLNPSQQRLQLDTGNKGNPIPMMDHPGLDVKLVAFAI